MHNQVKAGPAISALGLAAIAEPEAYQHRPDQGIARNGDELGRRAVCRETARRLFTERAAAEARRREARERYEAEYAEQAAANPVWAGVSAALIPDGVSAATVMLQAAKDAGPRRRSVLDHALATEGVVEDHPVGPVAG